ncbi:DUF6716 putative glycosyltransferase [Agromyces humatus]|uniref:Glycosyltransferase n=1 Tax=Agromyces humatus TaxID=279573 RepID=A0ABP4X9I8_9MICO|nr:DUF6716 putative glycosyltransferase [Agromyces humatus]
MRPRLLVLADSDSYVKWGAAFASRLPDGWRAELVILATPVAPSERQLRAALAGSVFDVPDVTFVELHELEQHLAARRPDVVLLAMRGPLVRVITPIVGRAPDRPVLVSGFPGLTIPAEPKAIIYREQVDLIVLASRREVREFRANAERLGIPVGLGLTTLPFLTDTSRADVPAAGAVAASAPERTDLVFAAQAKVPPVREDRVRLLGWLVDAARRRPSRRVVVKVRARRGEAQTHEEAYDFGELLDDPDVREELGGSLPPNLVVEDGPMAEHLERAAALVTVSSTAVLEAVAAGVPAVVIDEFGVSPKLINTVFEGSGLFAGAEAIAGWDPRYPSAEWLDDNYFHGREHDDWPARVGELLERRAAAPLPLRDRRYNLTGGPLRRAFERKRMLGEFDRSLAGSVSVVFALPSRWVVRRARQVRRRLAGEPATPQLGAREVRAPQLVDAA